MDKVKQILACMESLGVISRAEDPTDWSTGIIVVPRKTGAVCIYLTKLNKPVFREKYISPFVEETLGNWQVHKSSIS